MTSPTGGTTTAQAHSATEFEVTWEGTLPGTPEDAWYGVTKTDATAGWIWPMEEMEPRVGGREIGADPNAEGGAVVTAWEHPTHLANHMQAGDWYNTLDYRFEPTGDGNTRLQYSHRGVFPDNFETNLDACEQHTALYNHSLGQYLQHFNRRPATCFITDAPASSGAADAMNTVRAALGLGEHAQVGERVQVEVPGFGTLDAEVDFLTHAFIGLRDANAMYRFYGRNHFNGVVGFSEHRFDGDANAHAEAWNAWLQGLFPEADAAEAS